MIKSVLVMWLLIAFITGGVIGGYYMNIRVKSEQEYSAKLRDRIQELESASQ